jgi:NADH dehydrogenase
VVQSIGLASRTVTTVHASTREATVLPYDQLVIALGMVIDLSSVRGVHHHGLPIKTIGDALQIRNQVLDMLEGADAVQDPAERRRMLTFVVAGGGFSGVEVVAELNDFIREVCTEYRRLDPAELRIVLVHSGERILPELSEGLARYAHRKLVERGVEIQLRKRLAAATATEVVLSDGSHLNSRTLVVAIGAEPNPIVARLPAVKERGRLVVDEYLQLVGQPGVWALGDCARVPNPQTGEASPPTAQFALREGKTVATNVAAALGYGKRRRFQFTGLGQLLSLGRRSGVAEIRGGLRLSGLPAWMLWRAFYLMRLPGLERKIKVLLDWTLDLPFRRDLVQLNVGRTQTFTTAHYEAGEEIVRQGDRADLFYVVLKGQVQVVNQSDDGPREVARLGPGEYFGEIGLLKSQPRNATVRALESVDVLSLERPDFEMLVQNWDQLSSMLEQQAQSRG